MLKRIGRWARRQATSVDPWTNVYGVARSLLALSTALTLTVTAPSALFVPAAGVTEYPQCSTSFEGIGLFCLLPASQIHVMRWAAVAALLLVASGWRPRLTGLLHWWVTYSLAMNAMVLDGGDTVASILTLLLVPVTLMDDRVWHWRSRQPVDVGEGELARRLLALTFLALIRLQVAGIYFHAAVAKMSVPEWVDGTVLYYVLNDPVFGAAPWLSPVASFITTGPMLPLAAWAVLVLEYFLSTALILPKAQRGWALLLGTLFHLGIILLHGLVSFGLTMMAALVLFSRPVERSFALPRLPALRVSNTAASGRFRRWLPTRRAARQVADLGTNS